MVADSGFDILIMVLSWWVSRVFVGFTRETIPDMGGIHARA
jgi:hypothetical protein